MATQQYDVLNTQHCTLKMIKVVHLCYIYLPQKIIMSPEGVKSEKNVLSHVTHQLPFLPVRPSHETPPTPSLTIARNPMSPKGFSSQLYCQSLGFSIYFSSYSLVLVDTVIYKRTHLY